MASTSNTQPGALQRRILTTILEWHGLTILISFEPDWLGLGAAGVDRPYAHLEMKVLDPPGAPIPMGDFGYWSEFMEAGSAEDAGGPAAVAEALLDEFADSVRWRSAWARWEQRDLFA